MLIYFGILSCAPVQPLTQPTRASPPPQPQVQAVTVVIPTPATEEKEGEKEDVSLAGGGREMREEERTVVESLEDSPMLRQKEQPQISEEKEVVGDRPGGALHGRKLSEDKPQGESEKGNEVDPSSGDTVDGAREGVAESVRDGAGGELMRVESVASGDLTSTSGVGEVPKSEEAGEEKRPVEEPVERGEDVVDVDHTTQREEEEKKGEGAWDGVELTPVETIRGMDRQGKEEEKAEEKVEEKEEEKVEEREEEEVEEKEEEEEEKVVEERKEDGRGGAESQKDEDPNPKETQPITKVIQVKPVDSTSVSTRRTSVEGMKSSSSSSLIRVRSKPSTADKSRLQDNLGALRSLTQLKSTSATQVGGGSASLSRSRESLKAASQVYGSISRSRESLKKTESGSKLSSKSRESLKSSEGRKKAEKPHKPSPEAVPMTSSDVAYPGQVEANPSEGKGTEESGEELVKQTEGKEAGSGSSQPEGLGTEELGGDGTAGDEVATPKAEPQEVVEGAPLKSEEGEQNSPQIEKDEDKEKEEGEEEEKEKEEGEEQEKEEGKEEKGKGKEAEKTPLIMLETATGPPNSESKIEEGAELDKRAEKQSHKPLDSKLTGAEVTGSKSSLRGSRVKLTNSSKRSISGSKSSLNKQESASATQRPQQVKGRGEEEGGRKSPSVGSLKVEKIEVDKRTGQSESSITEAVERSRREEEGEERAVLSLETPKEAGKPEEAKPST